MTNHARDLVSVANGNDITRLTAMIMQGTEQETYATLQRIHTNTRATFIVGAPPALNVVFDTMLNPDIAPQTRLMAALAILDRAGHSTKTLGETQNMRNASQNINEMSSDDIMKALQSIQSKLESLPAPSTNKAESQSQG